MKEGLVPRVKMTMICSQQAAIMRAVAAESGQRGRAYHQYHQYPALLGPVIGRVKSDLPTCMRSTLYSKLSMTDQKHARCAGTCTCRYYVPVVYKRYIT